MILQSYTYDIGTEFAHVAEAVGISVPLVRRAGVTTLILLTMQRMIAGYEAVYKTCAFELNCNEPANIWSIAIPVSHITLL